jgi:hypothetical protein
MKQENQAVEYPTNSDLYYLQQLDEPGTIHGEMGEATGLSTC